MLGPHHEVDPIIVYKGLHLAPNTLLRNCVSGMRSRELTRTGWGVGTGSVKPVSAENWIREGKNKACAAGRLLFCDTCIPEFRARRASIRQTRGGDRGGTCEQVPEQSRTDGTTREYISACCRDESAASSSGV